MTLDRYFEFLRFSLIDGYPVPRDLATMDWRALYNFGVRQALTGVLFLGIKKLPEGIAPPNDLLMQWVMAADRIRKQNIRVNNMAVEIFRQFTSDGFRCCVLKGQGNAVMYADPFSRASGDIDLWTCGYADAAAEGGYRYPGTMGVLRKTLPYIKHHFNVNKVVSHHSSFTYKGLEVEVHHTPLVIYNPLHNRRFQQWCRKNAVGVSGNLVALPETAGGEIAVPTVEFNLIYQLAHIFHHLFDMGIGMRQLTDYYLLLMKYPGDEQKTNELRRDLRRFGLWKIGGAVMWVLGETLHLPKKRMLVPVDERRGKMLFAEIMNGGNFGKYDKKFVDTNNMNLCKKFFTKTFRHLPFIRYYPDEALSEPLCRVLHFVSARAAARNKLAE